MLRVHSHNEPHAHVHGIIDPDIISSERGIWATKWSFLILIITTIIQAIIVYISGSIALLADTLHNLGDSLTAIPLAIAFYFAKKMPTRKFTYGYGRVEDFAGLFVVFAILVSGLVAGYESINRLLHPQKVDYVLAIASASLVGFLGNEGVAIYRIRVGKEIGSAALIADGYHARIDGFVSLGVLISALGIWLGYPLTDPIIGLLMTVIIFRIVWTSSSAVFSRILDGIDPALVDELKKITLQVPGVEEVNEVRMRWLGHRLNAEVNITVNRALSIEDGDKLAKEVEHELMHHLEHLSKVIIYFKPS